MRKAQWTVVAIFGLAYLSAYLIYRKVNTEIWSVDKRSYVIYGSKVSYYCFRPISYLDSKLTGMRFHIGPHQGNANVPE